MSLDKDSSFPQKLGLKSAFPSRVHLDEYVSKLPALLQAKGYIASSLDSATNHPTHTTVYIYFGNEFRLGNLKIPDEHLPTVRQVTGVEHLEEKITFYQFNQTREKLLDYFENNGYPFAQIHLEEVKIDGQFVDATLFIDKGILYKLIVFVYLGPPRSLTISYIDTWQ
jgi:outer membrane protein assembly factor BamA